MLIPQVPLAGRVKEEYKMPEHDPDRPGAVVLFRPPGSVKTDFKYQLIHII
jgi:hypothetical protein